MLSEAWAYLLYYGLLFLCVLSGNALHAYGQVNLYQYALEHITPAVRQWLLRLRPVRPVSGRSLSGRKTE